MPTRLPPAYPKTVEDIARELGDIPVERIRLRPPIGTATIADLERPAAKGCELVDGTLVEKAMGWHESALAVFLGALLDAHVRPTNLGIVSGEEGGLHLLTGLVRKPDVAFISWDRLPGRRLPQEAFPGVAPDLVVEILSRSNTPAEMRRKRREYFKAGVRVVWEVNPRKRTVTVYTSPRMFRKLAEDDRLTGDPALPGFSLALRDLFAELDRHG